jgi:hypothetical protein
MPPATPTITAVPDNANGFNVVRWTNSDSPARVEVHRASPAETNGSFIPICTLGEANWSFLDRNAAHKETYSYQVVAVDNLGARATSAIVASQLTLPSAFIHAVTKRSGSSNGLPGASLPILIRPPHNRNISRQVKDYHFAHETMVDVEVGSIVDHNINLDVLVTIGNSDDLAALEKIFARGFACVRDLLGHKWFVTLPEMTFQFRFNTEIPLNLKVESYDETA